ncbi:MAG: WS/DGAT domain-containing protein [Steroidobacteraceae bacterium]
MTTTVAADAFAVPFKLHHTAFDGIAAASTIFAMLQRSVQEQVRPPEPRWVPERSLNALEWMAGTASQYVAQSLRNARAIPGLTRSAIKAISNSNARAPAQPVTRFQKPVSSHRVFDWVSFPMSEVQVLRAALDKPKMNDLALCIIAGGLRRFLHLKGELPDQPLSAACPINVRGKGDPMAGGNHVSFMRVDLATTIKDPLERLQVIIKSTTHGKAANEDLGATFVGDYLALFPYPLRAATLRGAVRLTSKGAIRAFASTTVTNVANPPGDFFFAGSKVLSYAGLGPVYDGYGLFHTITSMGWELSISATSCRQMLPDISTYLDCLRQEYAMVLELARVKQPDRQRAAGKATGHRKPRSNGSGPRRKQRAAVRGTRMQPSLHAAKEALHIDNTSDSRN